MFKDIDIDEKIYYINALGYNNIVTNEEYREDLENEIRNSLNGRHSKHILEIIREKLNDADLTHDYYDYPYNESLTESEVNEIFEKRFDLIIENTDFLEEYPQYSNTNNLTR